MLDREVLGAVSIPVHSKLKPVLDINDLKNNPHIKGCDKCISDT